MATYKAVMRPDLEYVSSVWSPLASSTSINKLQVMQNAALRTATGCTQDTNICMTKNSHFLYTSTYNSTPHNTNRKHNIHHVSYTNTQHTSTLQGWKKHNIFNNCGYTTNIPTDPHTVTTTDIKTNMLHIHTSVVSRHLSTRGNNNILHTLPPHFSSSEEILPRLTRRTLAQLRTNKSSFLKSYLHKVDATTHPSPLFPLCNIHTHDTHHLFNCTHIRTTLSPLNLWTEPAGLTALLARWTEKLAGGPQAGTSDSPPPPLARVMGVGRQQHLTILWNLSWLCIILSNPSLYYIPLTSIVVISGMTILLTVLLMYDIWLVLDDMLLASCGPIETKKNSSAITWLLVINLSLMEFLFIYSYQNVFHVFLNVRLINFKLIAVILNFHVCQIGNEAIPFIKLIFTLQIDVFLIEKDIVTSLNFICCCDSSA